LVKRSATISLIALSRSDDKLYLTTLALSAEAGFHNGRVKVQLMIFVMARGGGGGGEREIKTTKSNIAAKFR
jgi:hypothetical protein